MELAPRCSSPEPSRCRDPADSKSLPSEKKIKAEVGVAGHRNLCCLRNHSDEVVVVSESVLVVATRCRNRSVVKSCCGHCRHLQVCLC